MFQRINDLSPTALDGFDMIIDARSPSEFADDHLPGAVNLPVLNDMERERVGTIYKQVSTHEARRLGAGLVARNIAAHLEGPLADAPKDFRPLVYCWRGGMRSGALATVLSQVGWKVAVVDGGWKTWRRCVVETLHADLPALPMVLVDGETGAAKTDIIRKLIETGARAIDLEGLASHRGSVFGVRPGAPQPAQKLFESLLYDALRRLPGGGPVVAEAESAMIGRLRLPKFLLNSMRAAPRVEISVPRAARAGYLARAYRDLIEAPEQLAAALERLRAYHAKEDIEQWRALIDAGAFEAFAQSLIERHYDPLYRRTRAKRGDAALRVIPMEAIDETSVASAAAEIARLQIG